MMMRLTWAELVFDTLPPANRWSFNLAELYSSQINYIPVPMIQPYLVHISDLMRLSVG